MSSEESWNPSTNAQQFFADQWAKALSAFPSVASDASHKPGVQFDSSKLQALQQDYVQEAAKLWANGLASPAASQDKRFGGAPWLSNPLAALTASTYLLNAKALTGMADAIEADEKTRQRVRFAVEQWVAAMSPSNYLALNPEAQQKAIETKGESIAKGLQNLMHDLGQGHVSMTDESLFEVGKNVATTEGAVVFENALFQLIEYKPLTAKVFEKPFLLIPPCINKYYILDLQPENSLIRYAVSQGHRTFVVSWRNPDESLGHLTWDDYIEEALLRAIKVVQEIGGTPQINALGFFWFGANVLEKA